MSWLLFKQKKADPLDGVLAELSPQSKEFFQAEEMKHYNYEGKDTGFTTSKKMLNHASQINCAEYQQRFMQCLTDGAFKERMMGCHEKQVEWDGCLAQQMEVFHKLGLQYVKDLEMFEKGVGIADLLRAPTDENIWQKRAQLWK